jgi:heat-inducible transcriptional repressor
MTESALTEREKTVLRYIIQQFILTASPVGSRNVAKRYDLNYSPATIRNVMSDLEESGFVNHPHTSAGRVPTDKGYRFYVDSLMELENLASNDIQTINTQIPFQSTTDDILAVASRLLSNITHQLACVLYPRLDSGILKKIQLVVVSSSRLLIVLSVESGLVKTITLEINAELKESQIRQVEQLLNERLAGLLLKEIRDSIKHRVKDISEELHPIVTVFMESADKIFAEYSGINKAIISGAGNLIRQPEFENPERLETVIELIEDKDIIVHVFEKSTGSNPFDVNITIGAENEIVRLEEFSIVSKKYELDNVQGTLGVIGPKRMEYAKVVAIVDYIAMMLSEVFKVK